MTAIFTKPRNHRWVGEHKITARDSADGNERTERGCVLCGVIKITVHPPHGLPWRAWRDAHDPELGEWRGPRPRCVDRAALESKTSYREIAA